MATSHKLAVQYEVSSKAFQTKYCLELLNKIPEPIQRGWRVLDIGCGTGTNTEIVARKVGEEGLVVAVDPNSQRTELFANRIRDKNFKQLRIFNIGAETLDYTEYPPFDLAYANTVLHWIEESALKNIFQKVYQNLKSGGYFAACVPEMKADEGDFRHLFFTSLPSCVRERIYEHVGSRWLSWYTDLAKEFGFQVEDKGYIYVETVYSSLRDMCERLTGTFEGIVDFSDYLSLELLQKSGIYDFREDGSFSAVNRCSYFVARKL